MKASLLVTRPEPDAARTAAALAARGYEVLTAPLLRVETVAAELGTGPWAAVLMTSANAARALTPQRLRALAAVPLLAVGARTADAARAAGFADITVADGDVVALVDLLAARFADKQARLLYLAGEDRAADLAAMLAGHGVTVETAVVYRAVAAREFPPDLRGRLAAGEVDGVLHYSRRSAAAFLDCARQAEIVSAALRPAHYCLAPEIAAVLAPAGAEAIRIASRPDETALIELIVADRGG